MIPFRSRVPEQSNPSNQTTPSTEPQKPSIEGDQLLEEGPVADTQDVSYDGSQVLISLEHHYEADGHRPVPPAPLSEAVASSGGKSLSCPTENDVHDRKEGLEEEVLRGLFEHDNYDQEVRLQPLELDTAASDLDSDEYEPGVLPWKFEFSWNKEVLLFGGDTFYTQQTTLSPSEGSGAVVGGTSLASAAGHTVRESILSNGTANTLSLGMACFKEGEIQRVIIERRQYLIDVLEQHYFRAHPPQRTGGRKSSNRHSGIDTSSRPSSTKDTSRKMNCRRIAGSKRGKSITGDGDGGDQDEDETGKAPDGTPQPALISKGPYFACPYLKWKPQKYEKCFLRFRTISHMIGHLEEKHFFNRCSTCWISFATPTEMKRHRQKNCYGSVFVDPVSLYPDEITDEQLARIKQRPERKYQGPECRWHRIFNILFPESPPPDSVYHQEKLTDELMDGLLSYFQREGARILTDYQDEQSREDRILPSEPRDVQSQAVREGFITQVFTRILSGYRAGGDSATESCQQNERDDHSESQLQARCMSVHGDSKQKAAKGKSVRFAESTTGRSTPYPTLSTLTEEVEKTSLYTTLSQQSSEGSSYLPSALVNERISSSPYCPNDDFLRFTMGDDYITTNDGQVSFQKEHQSHPELLDLDLTWSRACKDVTIQPHSDAGNTLELNHTGFLHNAPFSDLSYLTSEGFLGNKDYPMAWDPTKDLHSMDSLRNFTDSTPPSFEQGLVTSCQGAISPVSDKVNDNGELNPAIPRGLSHYLGIDSFPVFESS